MKTPDIFDLYTDYLITSFSYTTATGLSGFTFSFFTLSFYVTKLGGLFDSFKGNRQACFL
jgi:hypothetical protein